MLPMPIISMDTLASSTETRHTGTAETIAAKRNRFIMHQARVTLRINYRLGGYGAPVIARFRSILLSPADWTRRVRGFFVEYDFPFQTGKPLSGQRDPTASKRATGDTVSTACSPIAIFISSASKSKTISWSKRDASGSVVSCAIAR
jgi:hypothetical protein